MQGSDHFRPVEAKVEGPCTKEPRSGEHGLKGNKPRGFQVGRRWPRAPCVHTNLANMASPGQTPHLLCLGQSLGPGPPADLAAAPWSCGRAQGRGRPHPTSTCGSRYRRPRHGSRATGTGVQHDPGRDRQASCTQAWAARGVPAPDGPVQAPPLSRPCVTSAEAASRTAGPRPPRKSSLPVPAPGFPALTSDLMTPRDLTSSAAKVLNCFAKHL